MASFEFLAIIFTGLGLTVSILYYTTVLRNANKTRELQLQAQEHAIETRQVQLYMDVYKSHVKKENQQDMLEMLRWEWKDYEDFETKYGVPGWAQHMSYFSELEGIAFLLMNDFLDANLVYDLQYHSIISVWEKFLPLTLESREIWSAPYTWDKVEYLYDEMRKIQAERGHEKAILKVPSEQ